MERLEPVPIYQREAFAFVARHHRTHKPPVASIFQVALARGARIVGVAIVNRPVAVALDDRCTAEVIRCCVLDEPEARHAASKLYATCWRIAREMGYSRLITYTLADETGVSIAAAGWRVVYQSKGHTWNHRTRPRIDRHPLGDKTLWEIRDAATGAMTVGGTQLTAADG